MQGMGGLPVLSNSRPWQFSLPESPACLVFSSGVVHLASCPLYDDSPIWPGARALRGSQQLLQLLDSMIIDGNLCYAQVVARRQTFWDTAIQLITSQSQESNLLTAFVRLICTAVINFTAGMLCSIFLFAFQLPSMVMSYQVLSYQSFPFSCHEASQETEPRGLKDFLSCFAWGRHAHACDAVIWRGCHTYCRMESTSHMRCASHCQWWDRHSAVQASWAAMLGFTCLALLGAMSVIVSFLAGLYAAGATAIYASASLAASQSRIAGRAPRPRPALRPHMD